MEIENLEQDTQLEREEREQEIFLSGELYASVGDGKLTIQKNGTDIGSFTANQSEDTNINIIVPTATSELTNDANFQNANDLSTAISNHNQSSSAHQDIRQAITDEATARFNADNSLQGQIDAITSASDVVDIVGTYAELQAYDTQHLKDNDVVKVLQDETHNDAMTYWRWSTHTQTWTYIGAEGPYYTKSETNTLLDEKLDADEVPDGFFDGPATITPASSTSVTIKDSIKLKSVELLGDTTQQTYSGYNLFNKDGSSLISQSLSSFTRWGYKLPKASGDFYVTKSIEDNVNYRVVEDDNGTLTIKAYVNIIGEGVKITNSNNDFYILCISTQNQQTASGYFDANNFMMAYSDVAYEPYVGGTASPNPDYPQNVNVVTGTQTIKATGKNLWSFDSSYSNSSGIVWVLPMSNFYLKAGTYIFSWDSTTSENIRIGYMLASGTTYSKNLTKTGHTTWIATFAEDVIQIGLRINNSNTISNIQLEKGSTATDYQPYQSQSYTVDLGSIELCKIGTYQDKIYKSGDDWYVHKECGKTILDGSVDEGWGGGSSGASPNCLYVYTAVADTELGSNAFQTIAKCSHFTNAGKLINNSIADNVSEFSAGATSNTKLRFLVRKEVAADRAAWETWLGSHNISVYYRIATPTDTKITDSSLISQLNAVLNATLYQPTTIITSSGNLAAILGLEAFTDNLNSLLEIASEPTPESKTYSDFVGTDGITAGTAGLVPAPATTDAGKFLKADGTWDTAGGGSTINVVQTVGNSQTDVMSQRAITSMVFKDPTTRYQTLISGGSSDTSGTGSVALGYGAQAYGQQAIAIASGIADASRAISIGGHANNSQGAKAQGSIALGYGATTTQVGEMNIGSSDTSYGYNSSNYRLLSGVYDGQGANDAVNVGQVNDTIDAINTALGTNIPHIGAST